MDIAGRKGNTSITGTTVSINAKKRKKNEIFLMTKRMSGNFKPAEENLGGFFSYLTSKIFIFCFFSKNANAPSDTRASKAFPMPKSKAMPISEGVHTPVK